LWIEAVFVEAERIVKRWQMETILMIGFGGFVGANIRYLITLWAAQQFGMAFPWGTLLINFSGSLLLAVFLAFAANHSSLDPRIKLLIATGFFGAYTTFSTYTNDSVALARAGDWIGGLGNILGSNLICIAGVVIGLAVGSRL
jgi:CrcB protein